MTSEYEDTTVDEIDFSKLSDDQVKDIAENDSRSTAQEKAQAELNRRESASGDDASGGTYEYELSPGPISKLPEDPAERAEALGLNTEGMNFDPDFGQLQVQEYADAVDISGFHPPTGEPPDDSETLIEMGKREEAEKEARREAMEGQAKG